MNTWVFEPGHTAAEFRAKHMKVTWVRGHFKNVHGTLKFDPKNPRGSSVEVRMNAKEIWTGEPERDAHLKSADFLDAENHPEIIFKSREVQPVSEAEYRVTGDLTIRGLTRKVTLEVRYLGQEETPFWVDGVDRGPKIRAGFMAETRINRHDFGVSWDAKLPRGGDVVGPEVFITIDAEAILESGG